MGKPKYDTLFTSKEKEQIKKEYLQGCSIREICQKYSIKSKYWVQYVLLKNLTRNFSEAAIISHKKYPEKFKHSEKTKQKLRKKRLNFMKEHPEQTAWRKNNEPSYPEKCFIEFLNKYGYDEKYLIEREYPIFPYYVDFAFINEKVAVEIDGSQHLEEDRKKRDIEKDRLLISMGWKVIRISENTVKSDFELIDRNLKRIIEQSALISETEYIKTPVNLKSKKTVSKNGKVYYTKYKHKEKYTKTQTLKQYQQSIHQRKVKNRPTKEKLCELIKNETFCLIGKKFGVSDNTIRKWCKQYGLPYRKKDIKI